MDLKWVSLDEVAVAMMWNGYGHVVWIWPYRRVGWMRIAISDGWTKGWTDEYGRIEGMDIIWGVMAISGWIWPGA